MVRLIAYRLVASSHRLWQCWLVIYCILVNKLQSNLNQIKSFSFNGMHLKDTQSGITLYLLGCAKIKKIPCYLSSHVHSKSRQFLVPTRRRAFVGPQQHDPRVTVYNHSQLLNSNRGWWRHQMETFSASLDLCEGNPPVTGGTIPLQKPVMRSFDVFFGLRLIKRLNKQSRRTWFETSSLWRICNGIPRGHHRLNWIITSRRVSPRL